MKQVTRIRRRNQQSLTKTEKRVSTTILIRISCVITMHGRRKGNSFVESCVAYAKAKSTKNQKKGSGAFIIVSPQQNDLQTTASSVIVCCVQNVIQQSFLVNKHKRNSDLYICYMNLKICMSICTIRRMKLD